MRIGESFDCYNSQLTYNIGNPSEMAKNSINISHANKVIYWNEKDRCGQAFILVGYCPNTLNYFSALFEEAKKSYPELSMGEVTCSEVRKSDWCKGYTLITFSVNKKAEGWWVRSSEPDFWF